MAKKKKTTKTPVPPSSASSTAPSVAVEAPTGGLPPAASSTNLVAPTPRSTDPEAARIEAAFDVGNFSQVRQLAAQASSSEAQLAVARLMPRVFMEREQIVVGLIGLAVVLVAGMLTLS